MLSNISQIKGNQIIKLGQLVDYDKKKFFLLKLLENEAGKLVPDLLLFF